MENNVAGRIFLLSPAYAGGERARMILSEQAEFDLARKLRDPKGVPIAEVFTFLSGLYFRGKIAYANAFARPLRGMPGVFIITPTRGLVDARMRIRLEDLREFAVVDRDPAKPARSERGGESVSTARRPSLPRPWAPRDGLNWPSGRRRSRGCGSC